MVQSPIQPPNVSSFFPTPLELTNGIQWLKENRVISAGAILAASAVTVLSYFVAQPLMEHELSFSTCSSDILSMESELNMTTLDPSLDEKLETQRHILTEENQQSITTQDTESDTLLNNKSPQWGWYISTTPDNEYDT